MPSDFQQEVLAELFRGATLRLRFGKYGQLGDFLLIKRGKVIHVVPRKTVEAICRIPRNRRSPSIQTVVDTVSVHAQEKPVTPASPKRAKAAPQVNAESPFLDDLARSLAGKAFARLSPYEQEHVRVLAGRIEP